jgi:phage shock protein PspC (stress-responsive transcriptional regulator)
MNETFSVNLSGRSFFIDTDAYQRLNSYLNKLKSWFKGKESGDEIISDIEGRIAELFSQKVKPETDVITIKMVEDAIATMGQPEDFEDGETTGSTNNKSYSNDQPNQSTYRPKKLYRDVDDRMLGGVCAGIAAYFNMETSLVRILYALVTIGSAGTAIVAYIVLWAVLPPAISTAQKLEMKGESINISNIEKKVKEEFEDVKSNFKKMKDSDIFKRSEEYFRNKDKKDRNLVIGVLVVIALFTIVPFTLFSGFPFIHIFSNGFHFPFFFFPFKLIALVAIILLIIGVASKNLLKPMIYIIIGLILLSILLKVIGWITAHSLFLT